MDRAEAEKLFEENRNLAYYALKKFKQLEMFNEDLRQDALMYLWEACLTYDSDRAAFSTYAIKFIVNRFVSQSITDSYQCRVLNKNHLSLDELNDDSKDDYIGRYYGEVAGKTPIYCGKDLRKRLSKREYDVFRYLLREYGEEEVAAKVGISHQRVNQLKRIIKKKIANDIICV